MIKVSAFFWGILSVGKMLLSCYVMQNIIASIIFYGWGIGLGGKVNSIEIVLIWLFISSLQVVFANAWLQHYKFGPMEMRKGSTQIAEEDYIRVLNRKSLFKIRFLQEKVQPKQQDLPLNMQRGIEKGRLQVRQNRMRSFIP